ncbi:hypothetical protein GIB67_034160 [Kingdonia uniflora]|uniref:Uncharacterized protein n=1 Tax=Kingdonia uniflora TaxID=39325 RepID=A0A7J7LS65_9MAGN|nr:hypothetical protein GIB67_034160 [Kingdonia uniflora]
MNGIDKSYTTWYCHGEPFKDDDAILDPHVASSNPVTEDVPRMLDLVDNAFMRVQPEDLVPSTNDVSSDDANGNLEQKGTPYFLGQVQCEQARKWVLESCDDVDEWKEKYKVCKDAISSKGERRRGNTRTAKPLNFIPWLREQLENKDMSTLKRLAIGLDFNVEIINLESKQFRHMLRSPTFLLAGTTPKGIWGKLSSVDRI